MRLVIVGSVGKVWTVDERGVVRDLIRSLIAENRTDDQVEEFIVGSGESPNGGVDIWAHEIADEMGVTFWPFPPKSCATERRCTDRFHHMFQPRDQQMADWCTKLIRIKSARATTYGSGWTRDQARKQGKPTEEYVPNAPPPEPSAHPESPAPPPARSVGEDGEGLPASQGTVGATGRLHRERDGR